MVPVSRFAKQWAAGLAAILLVFGLVSCGKKANPVAPVVVLPQTVELSAQVKGESLVITWPIPTQNTDGSPLKNLTGFRVQKADVLTSTFCPTCPEAFQETQWIGVMGPEVPGITIGADQVQWTLNQLTPGHTYLFKVAPVAKGESAGAASKTLRVAWELPLKAPVDLQAKTKDQGFLVSWAPVTALIDGSPATDLEGYALYRRMAKGGWVRLNQIPLRETSYFDDDLQEGVTYTYQVKALRRTGGQVLESEGSEPREAVFSRVAPPPQVKELLALAGDKGIEIRWEGLVTMTPSGYVIYRRTAQEKKPQRLNQEPLQDTRFEDQKVQKGVTYYYSVSALGAPPARLEGPRSREVEVVYNP
jgi:hypothetical protein